MFCSPEEAAAAEEEAEEAGSGAATVAAAAMAALPPLSPVDMSALASAAGTCTLLGFSSGMGDGLKKKKKKTRNLK